MKLHPAYCNYCEKITYRSKQRINESKKFGWKTYCSPQCHSATKNKQQLLKCSNPRCANVFKRKRSGMQKSKNAYCSSSCTASVNNSIAPKRKALVKQCLNCHADFVGKEKYCSVTCRIKGQTITKEAIIDKIKDFYKEEGRIPFRNEFSNAKAARLRFGSWNKAITAAGFPTNPIKFAKKYIANDGHKCDSLAEKIIDDWLYARSVLHQRSVPYHKNNMTADFSVNGTLIEFFGLQGELKGYDKLIAKKKKLWKEKGLKVIEIYPNHLLPKNRLDEILKF